MNLALLYCSTGKMERARTTIPQVLKVQPGPDAGQKLAAPTECRSRRVRNPIEPAEIDGPRVRLCYRGCPTCRFCTWGS
jgi:hypothetical protein